MKKATEEVNKLAEVKPQVVVEGEEDVLYFR